MTTSDRRSMCDGLFSPDAGQGVVVADLGCDRQQGISLLQIKLRVAVDWLNPFVRNANVSGVFYKGRRLGSKARRGLWCSFELVTAIASVFRSADFSIDSSTNRLEAPAEISKTHRLDLVHQLRF